MTNPMKITEEQLAFFAAQVAQKVEHNQSSLETKALIKGIEEKFNSLKELVIEGFRKTHTKQDYTNGKVRSHEKWLNENKEFVSDQKEERKLIKNKIINKGMDVLFKAIPICTIIYLLISQKWDI
jgi:uncharacterized protein YgiM (DUF1202 family)